MAEETFEIGELSATVVDNAGHGEHRAGYNGIARLLHRASARSLFVPAVSGMNLEHIITGEGEGNRDVFFEPRRAPMTLTRISDDTAELHQPPTPTFHVESWTTFRFVAPHHIDFTFTCQPAQHVFERGYLALFWASYINAPLDKSLYFRGGLDGQRTLWHQLCTQRHNDQSTVPGTGDDFAMTFADGAPDALYKNFSPLRFHVPLCYGHFEDLMWGLFFDRSEGIRLTHSPSGGGVHAELETGNPAWDFQFLIRNPEVMTKYSFRARAFLRPRIDRKELLREFEHWRGGH